METDRRKVHFLKYNNVSSITIALYIYTTLYFYFSFWRQIFDHFLNYTIS